MSARLLLGDTTAPFRREQRVEPANRSRSFMELLDYQEVESTVARDMYMETYASARTLDVAAAGPNITVTEVCVRSLHRC